MHPRCAFPSSVMRGDWKCTVPSSNRHHILSNFIFPGVKCPLNLASVGMPGSPLRHCTEPQFSVSQL